ncbi:MAG: hypothetical protein BWY11_01412 [Firmicutes bacterium ADurb.Bin182]|nr:MAG: hypothetical protein BWY11_01412 [Firmicutes bacterium ADurb.Bin182]
MKRKFIIVIEETVAEEFEVFAKNSEEALEKAKKNYKTCKFVLEPGNVRSKQMAIMTPGEDATGWFEF